MIISSFRSPETGNANPSLVLDFSSGVLSPLVSISRLLNTATAVDSSGLVKVVNANLPRFDYDPVSLENKGLLIEESRTNLILYSEEFQNFPWVVSDSSVSANVLISPSGAVNADKLTENSATTTHFIYTTLALQIAGSYSISIYVKAAGRTKFRIQQTATTPYAVLVDLTAKTVTTVVGGATGTISDAGNGWFLCTMSFTSVVSIAFNIVIYLANSAGSISYAGDGTSGLYLWGAQLEAGSFPTSYIPTTNLVSIRNADVATITGSNFTSFWNASSGSALVVAKQKSTSGISPVVQFDDNTANCIISLRGNTTNPELYVRNTTDQAQIDAGTIAANTTYRLAASWGENNCGASINSGSVVLDGVATIPAVTQARIGSNGANYLNGYIQSVEYYNNRVQNSLLQIVSSQAGYRSIIGTVFRDAIVS